MARFPCLVASDASWHAGAWLVDGIASSTRAVRRLLPFVDVAAIVAALALTLVEREALQGLLPLKELPPLRTRFAEYAILAVLILPLWLALAGRLSLFRLFDRAWTYGQLAAALLKLHVLGFVALATIIYATQVVVNRSLLGLFLVNSFVLMLLYRLLLVHRRRVQHRRGVGRTRLLLVGRPVGALRRFVEQVQSKDYPPEVVGYLHDDGDAAAPVPGDAELACLGQLRDLDDVLHELPVDFVVFFPPHDRMERVERELLACERVGVPALLAIDIGAYGRTPPRVSALFGSPVVAIDAVPKRADLLAVKHALDFMLATTGLLLALPVLLLVAGSVLVAMGRPVLFVQRRAGYRGRPFSMIKFRTMVVDAERRKAELSSRSETGGATFKLGDDPRVTRLGRFLRRTSLDELPQLVNVVAGTMSLVGPRPLPLDEQQRIQGWHRRRLAMRPGITGLWQVSGRSNVGFDQWMEYDLEYVDRWSLGLDLWILVRTIPAVVSRRGAV